LDSFASPSWQPDLCVRPDGQITEVNQQPPSSVCNKDNDESVR
jgi:hypothetical protein